jgi:hypothetical protein
LLDRYVLTLFIVLNAVAIAGTSYAHGRYGVALPNPFLIMVASGIAALVIRSCVKSVRR